MNKDIPACGSAMDLLKERQGYPLTGKIHLSQMRIKEWYEHWDGLVYVSFSGGKDSTVLVDVVRKMYPEVPSVFVDTGLEYPEIREFVRTIDNVTWLKPSMNFREVIEKYGYPVVSKENSQKIKEIRTTKSELLKNKRLHGDKNGNGKLAEKWKYLINAPFPISSRCCDILKIQPFLTYEKKSGRKPFIGMMANNSSIRLVSYLKHGCNSFTSRPKSNPLSFWTIEDVWEYIKTYGLNYSSIYDKGERTTGCMFCMFGVNREKQPNRFQRMNNNHPKLWDYCINNLGLKVPLEFMGVPYKQIKGVQLEI